MTVSTGAQDMSFHDKPMVSWPLRSLVLTFQVVQLVLGAPFYTAAPKLSHRTDHIPATFLLEELQVLESENRARGQAQKRAPVPGFQSPSSHSFLGSWGGVWPQEVRGHTSESDSPECNSSIAERPRPQPR